jgi:copper(I)-binding protein
MILRILTAVLAALLCLPAHAADYKLGSLEITEPWTRATPATAQSAGGFMVIGNKGSAPDRLIGARSTAADKVEVHEMRMEGNIMRMRELDKGLELAPGGTVELKPGGYHIMFIGLKAPFAKDARVPVTLVFEKAGSIDLEMPVRAMGAGQGHR